MDGLMRGEESQKKKKWRSGRAVSCTLKRGKGRDRGNIGFKKAPPKSGMVQSGVFWRVPEAKKVQLSSGRREKRELSKSGGLR